MLNKPLHSAMDGHVNALAPVAAPTLHVNTLWANGPLTSVLIPSEVTHGQAALVEAVLLRGEEPPPLTHPETDQTFYVIEGRMTFRVAGRQVTVPQGESIFIGRGLEHTFQVDTSSASVLILLTPGPGK